MPHWLMCYGYIKYNINQITKVLDLIQWLSFPQKGILILFLHAIFLFLL